jgi:hypothetical protein
MAVRLQGRVVLVVVCGALCVAELLAQPLGQPQPSQPKPRQGKQQDPNSQGFRTNPELEEIIELTRRKEFRNARQRATSLIDRPQTEFSSPKQERFFKGTAFMLRAEAAAQSGQDDDAALADYKKAAELGEPTSPYQVAARISIIGSMEPDPARRAAMGRAMEAYYLMGAELGDTRAMEMLESYYKARGQLDDEHYWFLIRRVDTTLENQRIMIKVYAEGLDEADREQFKRSMRERSLSGGEVPGGTLLPGRSTLTAASIDLMMRRQLAFVWRAFFGGTGESEGLRETFKVWRESTANNAFVTPYLLIRSSVPDKSTDVISVPGRRELASVMLPGDQVIVRCGSLVHQATVWRLDKINNELRILDPFYEFWQPTHNSCIERFRLLPYKTGWIGRDLVILSLSEVEPILEAVIALRDSGADTRPSESRPN